MVSLNQIQAVEYYAGRGFAVCSPPPHDDGPVGGPTIMIDRWSETIIVYADGSAARLGPVALYDDFGRPVCTAQAIVAQSTGHEKLAETSEPQP